MPDLDDLLLRVRRERETTASASRARAAEEQRLRSLRREADELSRRFDEGKEDHRRKRDGLRGRIAESESRLADLRSKVAASRDELGRIGGLLEPALDPRRAIAGLEADYPILLFPMRLETRFVTAGPAQQKQLLVRIYPDECAVDSFEPDLSESEVENLRRYWCSLWAAGGDEGLERAAWRELCGAHGAGRAMYLTQQYAPLAGSDPRPVRSSASAVILVVPVDAPIAAAAGKAATLAYWIAVWRAGKNQSAASAAFAALAAAVGAPRAEEVRRSVVPFNADERPQAGVDRATAAVSAAFVVLTPVATAAVKRQAWTRAPQAALLPERFVLVADSGPEHVELLSALVTQPLAVGPDPLAVDAEQFDEAGGDLIVPPALLWMTDFEAALKAGMAFRVALTPRQAELGFDRLCVLGVRFSADHERARIELEGLIASQARGQAGFAIVPQGTATNNGEEGSSGWTRVQEADELFDLARKAQSGTAQFDDTATKPYAKTDGLVLAEALGIDAAVLQAIPNADGADQAQARAMNAALWPATLGYWMDTQMRPVFDAEAIARTRRHFIDRVSGRGAIPAVRIGKQPYGILPSCALSRMNWMEAGQGGPLIIVNGSDRFLVVLRDLLRALARDFWDGFVTRTPRVGRAAANPQQQLLDILALHASSVEFHLNVLDSAERLWNEGRFYFADRAKLEQSMRDRMRAGVQLLASLGYHGPEPEIVSKFYSHVHGPMKRPTIDAPPLSETAELTKCTIDQKNYLEWCREKAQSAFEDLRLARGFSEGKTPDAVLYHVLRHALELGYHKSAVDLHLNSGLLTVAKLDEVYREPPFVHVADRPSGARSESRYRPLYAKEAAITGSPARSVVEFIPSWLTGAGQDGVLADQLEALGVLEHASTAALERAFAEHIDLCGYRWDAWMLSLVNERLHRMRRPEGDAGARRKGLYLGAFGWIEGLKADAPRSLATLPDAASAVFARPGQPPVLRDPENGGHVLAPSLNHAVTAAVLRNGYISNATPELPDLFAVDLSSSRVRVALQFIEGIRNGQPLGALLGYQFERRLHDRHEDAEMDRFIFQVRKAFPLASKHLLDSVDPAADTAAIEHVEARNVCDGLLLIEHVRTSPVKTYPWGKSLDPAGPAEQLILDEEVRALFDVHDAIADVAIAEAVHQVTVGNADRAAASMDAYGGKSAFPPEPDVVTTPRSGTSLVHRIGLHLRADAVAGAGATPRAQAEPAIDQWLSDVFPPLSEIVVSVASTNTPPGSLTVPTLVTMEALGLRPVDLLHLLDPDDTQAMGELDDRIVSHVITVRGLCPDAKVAIGYTAPVDGKKTAFQVAPLVSSLRALLLGARALKPTDAALPNEAEASSDEAVAVPAAQVTAAHASLDQLKADAVTLKAALDPLVLPAAPFSGVVGVVDARVSSFIALQHQAGLCGVALSGAGAALRALREWFELVRKSAGVVLARWQGKLAACDARLLEAVDPANSNLMQLQAAEKAEREISTTYTVPMPGTSAAFVAIVQGKRTPFVNAMAAVKGVHESSAIGISPLWTAWSATFASRAAIDLVVEDTQREEAQVRALVSDLHGQVSRLIEEVQKRIDAADDIIADAATAGGQRKAELMQDAVKALLGDGVRVIARFTLSADQKDEWQNAFDGRGAMLAHASTGHDFPVDDWLHGCARVRSKMHDLENVVHLTAAFGTSEPRLEPAQFPFVASEPWLAMEVPPGFDLHVAGDHVLYTASYPGGAFDKTAPAFAGLLIDEWIEVVPGTQETAGLAFHHDRPNNEPPQAMLLVTPASAGARWSWEDLRLAVPETFELAKKRACDPELIAATPLARLLPASLMAFTTHAISISSGFGLADAMSKMKVAPHA